MCPDDADRRDTPDAGWFPDPSQPGQERLWTGEVWSEWTRSRDPMRGEPTPTAWYSDPTVPDQERLWAGECWSPFTRPLTSAAVAQDPAKPRSKPKSLTILGRVASLLLGLTIVANLAVILAEYEYIHYVNEILGGGHPALSQIKHAVDASQNAGIAYSLTLFLAGIAFIWWFHRSYRNLSARGITELRFSSRWAIGCWLVPFLNLARPKAMANDIWKGSAGIAQGQWNRWSELPIPALLNWWWGCWIAGSTLSYIATRMVGDAGLNATSIQDALQQERTGAYLDQLASVVLIVGAVLAIVIVSRVSRLQDGHADPQPEMAQQPIDGAQTPFA